MDVPIMPDATYYRTIAGYIRDAIESTYGKPPMPELRRVWTEELQRVEKLAGDGK